MMFKRMGKQERMATPSLRMIDQECLCPHHKDLFEELLEEGDSHCHYYAASPCNSFKDIVGKEEEHPGCKCSKIDCLKLYCECFAKGRLCNRNCICLGCKNHPGNQHQIHFAQQVANHRNPGHFKGVVPYVPARRCTCKKSSCQKNYCECFRAGVKCGHECECSDCHNGSPCVDRRSYRGSWMEVQNSMEPISSLA